MYTILKFNNYLEGGPVLVLCHYHDYYYKETQTASDASGGVILGSVLAVGVLIFSVVAILIGISTVFGYKYKQSRTRKNSRHNEGLQILAGPLYEEIQPNSIPEHQDLVELQENVAYGPIVRI